MAKTKENQNKKKYENKPLNAKEATEKVNYIVENFDFHKVYHVMKSLNWKYFDLHKNSYYQPGIEKLRAVARNVLTQAALGVALEATPEEDFITASGGFMAIRYYDGSLHLLFYVEEQTSEFYEDENSSEVLNALIDELEERNLIEG